MKFLAFLAIIVSVATTVYLVIHQSDLHSAPVIPFTDTATLAHPPTTDTIEFFKLCTGVNVVDKETGYLVISNCMGRVRGFVDGHQMTVVMQQRYVNLGKKDPAPQLWCIDNSITDKQVFDTVLDWVNKNPNNFRQTVNELGSSGETTVAMAVVITALHQAYPCEEVQ